MSPHFLLLRISSPHFFGYNGNYWRNLAEWTVLPAAKLGIGHILGESSAIVTGGEIAGATLPETVVGTGVAVAEKAGPWGIVLATAADVAAAQNCAMMNDPNLMVALQTY